MRPIIEFCTNNMHNGTDEVMKKLEQNPDYDVIEYGCLGHCGECYMNPYALVDGEFVQADSPNELYDLVMEKIGKKNMFFDLLDDED